MVSSLFFSMWLSLLPSRLSFPHKPQREMMEKEMQSEISKDKRTSPLISKQHLLGRLRSNRLRHTLPLLRRLPNSLPTPTRLVTRPRWPSLLRHRHRQPPNHHARTLMPQTHQLPQKRPRNRGYTSGSHGICHLHCCCQFSCWRIMVCMDLYT